MLWVIAFIILMIFPLTRCMLLHPVSVIYYLVKDVYKYIRYMRWNEFRRYGRIICYTAIFGGGKTLSSTIQMRKYYKKFNNKKVYDFKLKKWLVQKIIIHSNVDFVDGTPYLQLKGSEDIINCKQECPDMERQIHLFLIDEASTQFNSRNFKKNLPTELLNQILTCRHNYISIYMTAQRFNHVDALLRQVTSYTIECKKIWRLMLHKKYDAWELENCSNLQLIKPLSVTCSIVKDKDFDAYDTFAIVENFKHEVEAGNILSDKEVLEYQSAVGSDITNVTHLSRMGKKRIK